MISSFFIYRGALLSGEHEISLWQGKIDKTKVDEPTTDICIEMNPSAPDTSNPHPKAVRLTVNFENTDTPVFYPSTSQESRANLIK